MKYCPKCNKGHEKAGTFCSRTCANSRKFSTDAIKKKSDSNKAWARKYPDVAKANAARANEVWISLNTPARYCLTCNKKINKNNKSGLCKKHFEESDQKSEFVARRKNYKRQEVYNSLQDRNVWLLSSLEISFYEILEKTSTKWMKPTYISYITSDGKSHRYFPDFYLPDTDEYIEVKGYYWPSDKIKMDLVMLQNPTLKIRILFDIDIEQWCP